MESTAKIPVPPVSQTTCDVLQGKVAVVTGGASGMGKAISLLFARQGAKVVVADMNLPGAEETVSEIEAAGGAAVAILTDVSKEPQTDAMIGLAVEKYGKLDILVNNAGIMDKNEAVGEVSRERWDLLWNVNTSSVLFASKKAVNTFLAQGTGGNIVNIASVGGLFGARAGVLYTASKHAVVGITRNTAYFYAEQGIHCNAIAPGGVNTNIGSTMTGAHVFGTARTMKGMGVMVRMGEADEVAQAALFLASDAASFVNGAVLTVDGGWTAY